MSAKQGFYSLIQFSPVPDRFEFINIGVMLAVPALKFFDVKYSRGQKRIEKLFGKQRQSYLSSLKEAIRNRLELEVSKEFSLNRFEKFAESRANEIRISRPLPVVVADTPKDELDDLFQHLVGESEVAQRGPRIVTKLTKELDAAGISHMLEKPEPVSIPKYGITIEAPYAYKNGAYNLIDPVRLSGDADDAFKEASKRAIEGQWLSNQTHGEKKLIVVGDLSQSQPGIGAAVYDMMAQHNVSFYSFGHLQTLIEEIRQQTKDHHAQTISVSRE